MKVHAHRFETGYSVCRKVYTLLLKSDKEVAKKFHRLVNERAGTNRGFSVLHFDVDQAIAIAARYGVKVEMS